MSAVAFAADVQSGNPRRADLMELVAVLLAALLVPFFYAIRGAAQGWFGLPMRAGSPDIHLFTLEMWTVLPVLCLMAQDPRGWSSFGLGKSRSLDAWLFLGSAATTGLVTAILLGHFESTGHPASTFWRVPLLRDHSWPARIGLASCLALSRGIVLRGFLITRLSQISPSGGLHRPPSHAATVAASTIAIVVQAPFAGGDSLLIQGASALLLAAVFAFQKRLLPTIAADLVVILVASR